MNESREESLHEREGVRNQDILLFFPLAKGFMQVMLAVNNIVYINVYFISYHIISINLMFISIISYHIN